MSTGRTPAFWPETQATRTMDTAVSQAANQNVPAWGERTN